MVTASPPRLKTLTCARCDKEWQVPFSRGRYPTACPDCRGPKPKPRPTPTRIWTRGRKIAVHGRDVLAEIRAAEARLAEAEERERFRREQARHALAEKRRIEREATEQLQAALAADKRRAEAAARSVPDAEVSFRARQFMDRKGRERVEVLFRDEEQAWRLEELLAVSEKAKTMPPLAKHELGRYVRRVGTAQGARGLRESLLELAAAALSAASAVPRF